MPAVVNIEDDDPEFADLEKAEKRAKRVLKKNHYRIIDLPDCCQNCANGDMTDVYDNAYACDLANHTNWLVGGVNPFGLCDKYKRMK